MPSNRLDNARSQMFVEGSKPINWTNSMWYNFVNEEVARKEMFVKFVLRSECMFLFRPFFSDCRLWALQIRCESPPKSATSGEENTIKVVVEELDRELCVVRGYIHGSFVPIREETTSRI